MRSSVRHWTSDIDRARAQAQQALDQNLARLREGGIEARGEVEDEDPLRAIEDALRTFGADEIVIWTGPDGIGRAAVEGARERFALPITHVQSRAQATSRVSRPTRFPRSGGLQRPAGRPSRTAREAAPVSESQADEGCLEVADVQPGCLRKLAQGSECTP